MPIDAIQMLRLSGEKLYSTAESQLHGHDHSFTLIGRSPVEALIHESSLGDHLIRLRNFFNLQRPDMISAHDMNLADGFYMELRTPPSLAACRIGAQLVIHHPEFF